jgi:hypothetical protein
VSEVKLYLVFALDRLIRTARDQSDEITEETANQIDQYRPEWELSRSSKTHEF